jgi:hypothetical protein
MHWRRLLWLTLAVVGAAGLVLALCLTRAERAGSSVRLTFTCDSGSCWETGRRHGESEGVARFTSGEIDLTGDSVLETISIDHAALVVVKDNEIVWRSEPGWVVVDAALGDPNQDGRYEVLLAFWRDDAEGNPRNQPFIIGYRGGLWRTLWGGSPVTDPILELALGDVDGDGNEDLVVIEAADGYAGIDRPLGAQEDASHVRATVAVWRWHGWGFSRMWRSPVGKYHDLVLLRGAAGAPDIVQVTTSSWE